MESLGAAKILGDTGQPNPLPLTPSRSTLTPGADAVPSPVERERVIRYSGDIEGKGNNRVGRRGRIALGDVEGELVLLRFPEGEAIRAR
jgi:hypothetical protein